MSEPSARPAARCHHHTAYCSRCDLLGGLDGLHVTAVEHHVSEFPIEHGGRGPKATDRDGRPDPDEDGNPRAPLLDLVPGRPGKAYSDWLEERGEDFKDGVEDATAVLGASHVVKLGTQAVDEVRHRVQQEFHGHRGRKNDPLYGIRTILRCGPEKLTDR